MALLKRFTKAALVFIAFSLTFAPRFAFAVRCDDPEAIYHIDDDPLISGGQKSVLEGNQMRVTRYLFDYLQRLGTDFMKAFKKLNGKSHWIDAGSGEGNALRQYGGEIDDVFHTESGFFKDEQGLIDDLSKIAPDQKAKVTGITYKAEIEGGLSKNSRRNIIKGKFFEEIPNSEITGNGFGNADLITDYYGVMAYTSSPDVVLQKYVELLKDDGDIFIYLGNKSDANILKSEVTVGSRAVPLHEWIKDIEGLDVSVINQERKVSAKSDKGIQINVLHIKIKNRSKVKIPKLVLKEYTEQSPPIRKFVQE